MPAEEWGWRITPEELRSWTLEENDRWLVLSKPAMVVCHPSKRGPWSSLIGACREYLGLDRLHMPFRLDRETSGVVIFVKERETAGLMQNAVTHRRVSKVYHAVLVGEVRDPFIADGPIGPHPDSPVHTRRAVVEGGSAARTWFRPIEAANGFTWVEVRPETGRMHQIRVHACHAGYPLLGDKIYGPGDTLYLRFIAGGMTADLRAVLGFERQALHCTEARFDPSAAWPEGLGFHAPLAADMAEFLKTRMNGANSNSTLGKSWPPIL